MVARPRLASISADLIDLETWQPQRAEDVMFPLIIEVGWEGEVGTNLFDVRVATPEACKAHLDGFVLSSRALILVSHYSYEQLELHVRKIVEGAVAETPNESCLALNRFFNWEYEDFVLSDEE